MKIRRQKALDFIIDKLTNSVENVQTGDSFPTNITLLSTADLKKLTKKSGWLFDWKYELRQPEREVYKLTIVNNLSVIQGLIVWKLSLIIFICTLLRVLHLIRAKQKYILVYPAILLPSMQAFISTGLPGKCFFYFKNSIN